MPVVDTLSFVEGGEQEVFDQRAVERAFGKSAVSYDNYAIAQREIASSLVELLEPYLKELQNSSGRDLVVDLGSGTGELAAVIHAYSSNARIVELDLSHAMLTTSREKKAGVLDKNASLYLQANFDQLPIRDRSAQLIASSLSLQWSNSIVKTLNRISSMLDAGAVFVGNLLLDGTLREIDQAWCEVDKGDHVSPMLTYHEAVSLLSALPLELCVVQQKDFRFSFTNVKTMLNSVRRIGASNHLSNRNKALLGKSSYKQFLQALENGRDEKGRHQLSYSVCEFVLRKSL